MNLEQKRFETLKQVQNYLYQTEKKLWQATVLYTILAGHCVI